MPKFIRTVDAYEGTESKGNYEFWRKGYIFEGIKIAPNTIEEKGGRLHIASSCVLLPNVKSLEWQRWFTDAADGSPREHSVTPFGTSYHISNEGWWIPLDKLNPCKDIEEARIKAQEDFEAKVRECLI